MTLVSSSRRVVILIIITLFRITTRQLVLNKATAEDNRFDLDRKVSAFFPFCLVNIFGWFAWMNTNSKTHSGDSFKCNKKKPLTLNTCSKSFWIAILQKTKRITLIPLYKLLWAVLRFAFRQWCHMVLPEEQFLSWHKEGLRSVLSVIFISPYTRIWAMI